MRRAGIVAAAILAISPCGCASSPEAARSSTGAPPAAHAFADRIGDGVFRPIGTDPAAAPRIDALVIAVHPAEGTGDGGGAWLRVDARWEGRRVFGYEMLVEDDRFLRDAAVEPRIRRYLVYPADGVPLEYVDARDGSPLLPRAAPPDWIPRGGGDLVWFLGRNLRRDAREEADGPWPREDVRRIALDPGMLIATSRDFRDDGTGRHGDDWRWVPLAPADYAAMTAAGFDLFRVGSRDLRLAAELPAFVVATEGWGQQVDLLLRGNFLGAVMYADEPAVRTVGELRERPVPSPGEVAAAIAEATRRTIEGEGKYGRGFLARRLAAPGFDYGEVRQPVYPVWEAVASAAWYEIEAGASGWCLEARLHPREFAADVERAVGVTFPDDPASCIRLHLALARGAGRRFDVPWGVSVYGQMDDAAADLLFPMAWNGGATYFWMWTSDGAHHVPHARQLQLARALRDHASSHPRGTAAEATRQATVAVALPWGYALDEFSLGGKDARLWDVRSLPLSAANEAGVPHRDVLAAAVREIVVLLGDDTEFDVLFLRDGERAGGYREVRRVGLDGRVSVEGP